MNVEEVREYCISKYGVTESFPFNETTLVFKVMNKMFALLSLEGDFRLNLKYDPELAIDLREKYSYVLPGYHMNKQLWNSVMIDETVPEKLICEWIDHSYELIVQSLTKKNKEELKILQQNGNNRL